MLKAAGRVISRGRSERRRLNVPQSTAAMAELAMASSFSAMFGVCCVADVDQAPLLLQPHSGGYLVPLSTDSSSWWEHRTELAVARYRFFSRDSDASNFSDERGEEVVRSVHPSEQRTFFRAALYAAATANGENNNAVYERDVSLISAALLQHPPDMDAFAESLQDCYPRSALPLCAGLARQARRMHVRLTAPVVLKLCEALQKAARNRTGDKGRFAALVPLVAQCIAECFDSSTDAQRSALIYAAKGIVGVARLAPWPTVFAVLDAFPFGVSTNEGVLARVLGSSAFVFRHLLTLPTSRFSGIPDAAEPVTAAEKQRLRHIIDALTSRWTSSLPMESTVVEGVRHGISTLIALGEVDAARGAQQSLETAMQLSAMAGSSVAPPGLMHHWTVIELRLRENKVHSAIECARLLGLSRRDGWATVPSVVVDCVVRLAHHTGMEPDPSVLLTPLLVAAASFRNKHELTPQVVAAPFVDALVQRIRTHRPSSPPSDVVVRLATSTASALSNVASVVPFESMILYVDAVVSLKLNAADASVCSCALWQLLQSLQHSKTGQALSDYISLRSADSEVARGVPGIFSTRSGGGRLTPLSLVWCCPACGVGHGSPSSVCRECRSSRFDDKAEGALCCGCVGETLRIALTKELSAFETPSLERCPACAACGSEGLGSAESACKSCSAALKRDSLFCAVCGTLSNRMVSGAARRLATVWQCLVCNEWSAWTDSECRHCHGWSQTPSAVRQDWDDAVRPVPCTSCHRTCIVPLVTECVHCKTPTARHRSVSDGPAESQRPTTAPTRTVVQCPVCLKASAPTSEHCDDCHAALPPRPQLGLAFLHTSWTCRSCGREQPEASLSLLCEHCLCLSSLRPPQLPYYGATALHALKVKAPASLKVVVSVIVASLSLLPTNMAPHIGAAFHALVTHCIAVVGDGRTRDQRHLAAIGHSLAALVGHGPLLKRGRCPHCGGTHPEAMCSERPHPYWDCDECGHKANSNKGATRYICQGCMNVRRLLFQLEWCDAWECSACGRVSCESDDACAHCGEPRQDGVNTDAALPFFPARCGSCGEVHLEALCPVCRRDDVVREEMAKGKAMAAMDHLASSAASSSEDVNDDRGSDDSVTCPAAAMALSERQQL